MKTDCTAHTCHDPLQENRGVAGLLDHKWLNRIVSILVYCNSLVVKPLPHTSAAVALQALAPVLSDNKIDSINTALCY